MLPVVCLAIRYGVNGKCPPPNTLMYLDIWSLAGVLFGDTRTFRRGVVAVNTGHHSVSLYITCTGDWDRGIFRDCCSVRLSLWFE